MHMKNSKILLSALALGSLAVACNPPPPATDAGTDGGTPMGDSGSDGGGTTTDGGSDAGGPPVDCATYCTAVTAACTGADAQYADATDCMTQCTAAGWTAGAASDTAGNTIGCRIYHATAASASATAATTHCPHAGLLSAAPYCTPFRSDPAVESTGATGYIRVDRMGMPAVATALIGPGLSTDPVMINAAKDDYNDSNPDEDSTYTSGIPLLTAIGTYHAVLDAQLVALGLTPCSVSNTFPVPGVPGGAVPACGVQHYDGTAITDPAGHSVASLILPDTLHIETSAATHFPNGRAPDDQVIDPILSVLLLNMSICAGTRTGVECPRITGTGAMATCTADANCVWNPAGTGSCAPAATSAAVGCAMLGTTNCALNPTCTVSGTSCVPIPCEAIPDSATAAACPAFQGCSAATCGTGGARCTAGTLGSLPLNPAANDGTVDLTTFPYFAAPN